MLILQKQLASLHDSVIPTPRDRNGPLAFSICTQGPIMELWIHHIVPVKGAPEYHMIFLAACHCSLSDDLELFLVKFDKVISWYKNDFLGEVADQLVGLPTFLAR